jgi:4-hydroxy-3-methylbut-2-enyl diphosphate reductase
MDSLERPRLTILLAGPRGFCAGVERAIEIVERALEKYGRPVYVRHDIVHNKTVVEELEHKGAVFVEELSEVPEGVPVVFSAHGVPKAVPKEAANRKLFYLDATCPLVTKVHVDAERHFAAGRQIILIGHEGHPEVVGTMGQLPEGAILLVQDTKHAETVKVDDPHNLAYVTQTTLSVDDCRDIVAVLTRRFPDIEGPRKEDICYATTNRQAAVKEVAKRCDALIVLGAPNSSNSNRLREVAVAAGCPKAIMIQRAAELDFAWLGGVQTLGITAGASAPEKLVQEVIEACRSRFDLTIEQVEVTRENVRFSLPRVLTA